MLEFLPWREIVSAGGGALLLALAYLAKRWWQGDHVSETLDRYTRALDLHQRLKSEGISTADLDALQSDLMKTKRKRQIEDEISLEILEQGPRPEETQGGMNRAATADLEIARAKLEKALVELDMYLAGEQGALLKGTQQGWSAYAEAEACLVAARFETGSIYPLVYAKELERLTVARIADLRAHLEWIKSS